MSRMRKLCMTCAAVLIAAVFGVFLFAPRTFDIAHAQPPVQDGNDTQVCPLSDKQEEEAPKKFAAMMPVFTNPRCINCHGAVDPFANRNVGKHVGGKIAPKLIKFPSTDSSTNKPVVIVVPDANAIAESCQDCHSGLPGWIMAPKSLLFVGKNTVRLCRQMKTTLFTAQGFIDHLDHEGDVQVKFLLEGFRGTRGLNAQGQAVLLNVTGREFKPEPPPVTHAQFVDQGRKWVEAMGGEFKGGATCGCQPHHYAFQIEVDEGVKPPVLEGVFKGHLKFKVPIKFEEDGAFTATTAVDIPVSGKLTGRDISCDITVKIQNERWKLEGKDEADTMHVGVTIEGDPWQVQSVCTSQGQVVRGSYTTPPIKYNFPFEMNAEVGETKTGLDWSNPQGGFDNVKITLLEEGN